MISLIAEQLETWANDLMGGKITPKQCADSMREVSKDMCSQAVDEIIIDMAFAQMIHNHMSVTQALDYGYMLYDSKNIPPEVSERRSRMYRETVRRVSQYIKGNKND